VSDAPVEIRQGNLDDSPVVVELLARAVGGHGRRLDSAVHRYRHDATVRLLLAVLDDHIVGLVGFTVGDSETTVLHIATAESQQRRGIGTKLVAAVSESTDHRLPLVAETDQAAVDFYRTLGFDTESLGERYPDVERFTVRRIR
jgi:ribosomal protein S18 acetylase RimI-like enzyme